MKPRTAPAMIVALLLLAAGCPGGDEGKGTPGGAEGASAGGPSTTNGADASVAVGDGSVCDPALAPEGDFDAQYGYVDGDCPPEVEGHVVRLGAGVAISNRVADTVRVTIVYTECQVGLTYSVLTKASVEESLPSMLVLQVEGDLDIHGATELSGTVTRVEYDPPGTPVCEGHYELTLTKNTNTIGAAAGGEGVDGGIAAPRFSDTHAAEITYDCEQTVQCVAQQGGALETNPIGACVEATGALLDGNPDLQEAFLVGYDRCSVFVVCDYVDCAQADAASYGDSKRTELGAMCAAEATCDVLQGAVGETEAVCIKRKVNELNSYIPSRRTQWELAFAACQGMGGCDFVDCFDAAFCGGPCG